MPSDSASTAHTARVAPSQALTASQQLSDDTLHEPGSHPYQGNTSPCHGYTSTECFLASTDARLKCNNDRDTPRRCFLLPSIGGATPSGVRVTSSVRSAMPSDHGNPSFIGRTVSSYDYAPPSDHRASPSDHRVAPIDNFYIHSRHFVPPPGAANTSPGGGVTAPGVFASGLSGPPHSRCSPPPQGDPRWPRTITCPGTTAARPSC